MQTKFPYNTGFLLKALLGCFWLFVVLGSTKASAQFIITEGFKNSTAPDVVFGGPGDSGGMAYLTSGINDPVGAGYLRLTSATTNQKGYAYIDKSFPSTMGVLIDFEYKMWRETAGADYGADGIGVFLFDATVPSFSLGGYGGSLGYARNTNASTNTGLSGGYIGIGFDAYGNFGNDNEGRLTRITGTTGLVPNAVVLRGPTTNNYTSTVSGGVQSSNRYLDHAVLGTRTGTDNDIRARNEIDYNTPGPRPEDNTFYRRVQIEIVRLDAEGIYYEITVRWKKLTSDNFVELFSYTTTDPPPALLKLGFAASTGGSINNHEIRNLMVTTPNNLRVMKRADMDLLRIDTSPGAGGANGNLITYTVEVTNDTADEVSNIAFTDRITDADGNLIPEGISGFNIETITPSGFVSAALPTASTLTTNEVTGTLVLAAGATGRVTITGRVYVIPTGNRLVNTATALPTFDEDLNNNTSEVRTPVVAEGVDLVVTKTVDQECIISSGVGNKYTMYVSNIGAANATFRRLPHTTTTSNRLAVYNVVPAGYTYDDSQTPEGFAGDAYSEGSGSAKWTRIVLPNNPSAGYTTYGYIARGTGSGAQTLNSGLTYPYPIVYTLKPTAGTTFYEDTSTALFFQGLDINANIEPAENLGNNETTIEMFGSPALPTVSSSTIYYCAGETAVPLTATKTNPAYNLRWYITPTGFASDYAITPPTNIPGTYTYYVSQVNGECEGNKASITVVVLNPTAGAISGNASICSGSSRTISNNTSGTAGSGGSGSISYRWESSTDNTNWNTIAGATSSSYNTPALTQTTYYRRYTVLTMVGGKICESVSPTSVITITVPVAGTIGDSQSFCDDGNAITLSTDEAGTTSPSPTYQWQRSTTGTGGWNAVPTSSGYPSSNSGSSWNPPTAYTTYYYRRRSQFTVTGGSTCTLYSNVVVVVIGSGTPTAGNITAAQTLCSGDTADLTTGNTAPTGAGTFEWSRSTTSSSSGFSVIAGVTSESYSPGSPAQTTWYRRRSYNGCNYSGYTNVIQVTVLTPTAGSIGNGQTLCYGGNPSAISSVAGSAGGGTLSYRWESAPGTSGVATWTTVAGETSATYDPPALTESVRYRRYTVSTSGSVVCEAGPTNEVVMTVKIATDPKTIGPAQAICNGAAPAQLTGPAAIGDGAITYQWQFSNDGSTGWTNIAGATSISYTPGNLSRYYRRVATAGGTCFEATPGVLVTYQTAPNAGTITAGSTQTICYNATPAQLTSATAGSGIAGATVTYRWETSSNGSTGWATAPGTSNQVSYQPPALTATTYYRRVTITTVLGNSCEAATSNVVVTVQGTVPEGTLGSAQTICYNAIPAQITGTAVTVSGATISYLWQYSADGSTNWQTAPGTSNQQNYTAPAALTANRYYRRITTSTLNSVACQSTPAATILVTVKAAVSAGTATGDQVICNNTIPSQLTGSQVTIPGATISYRWEYSSNGSTGWATAPGTSNGQNYTAPSALTANRYYRRITIATIGGSPCESEPTTLTILVTVVGTVSPGTATGSQTICTNTIPTQFTGSLVTIAGATVSYRWEYSANGSTGWATAPGTANGQNYTAPAALTANRYYRRITIATVGSVSCESSATTPNILVTIAAALNPGTISGGGAFCTGGGTPGYISSTNAGSGYSGGVQFAWQSSIDGGSNWSNISANSEGYSPSAITQTTMYRRVIKYSSGSGCEVYSNAVTFTILAPVNPGTISGNQTACYNTAPAQLTGSAVTGLGTVTYQWQQSSSYGSGYYDAPGVSTGQNYQPETAWDTMYYRRIAIDTYNGVSCQGVSDPVTVTMQGQMNGGDTSGSQTICSGAVPTQLTGSGQSGSGTLSYRWEQSANGTTGWTTAAGTSNTAAYQPPALSATTYYRRVTISTVGSSSCEAVSTTVVTITVQGVADAGSITSGDQSICYNITPAQITATAATSNGGTITYRWEQSPNGSTGWTTADGTANQQNYMAPAVLTATRYYRRIAISSLSGNNCELLSGGMVTVLVQSQLVAGNIGSGQSLCVNSVPAQLTGDASTGSGVITYQWEQSPDGSSWTTATGTSNQQNYQPPALSVTTIYRRRTIATANGISCEALSNTVYISIYSSLNAGSISGGDTFCTGGGDPGEIANSDSGSGANPNHEFIWQYSTDGGSNWNAIAGASSATYNPSSITVTTQYRRVVKSTSAPFCEVYSNAVTFTVRAALSPGTVSGSQTFCPGGGNPAAFASGTAGTTGGGTTYQWQTSTDGVNFSDIAGATSETYDAPSVTATTYYRRAVKYTTAPNCQVQTSNVVVTVMDATTAGIIGTAQSICINNTPVPLSSVADGTGSGAISYRWESSANGTTGWATIAGATGAAYSPGALAQTIYYRRITIATLNGTICESAAGSGVKIEVKGCKLVTNPTIHSRVKNGS